MKIAFVNHPLAIPAPPQRGSVQIWAHAVAARLARSNEVLVYCLRGGLPETESCNGIQYRRVSLPGWAPRWKSLLNKTPVLWRVNSASVESRWHQWEYGLSVVRDLRTQKCDIIQVMNLFHLVPVIKRFNPKCKIVLHMHCEWLNRLDRTLVARRLAKVALILGCSEYITEKIRRGFPKFSERCETVVNGVDVATFAPGDRGRASSQGGRILWTGRISPEKGLHILLDAFAQVLKAYPNAQLEVIGPEEQMPLEALLTCDDEEKIAPLAPFYDGRSYLSHLKERATSLGIADRVAFEALIPHSHLAERYRSADMFVTPSLSETFGMTLIEAMSCGLPVVASETGGMPAIVGEGACGILVEPGNAAALASAILRLLRDDRLRDSMGRAGRKRVLEDFAWDRVANAAQNHYMEVLDGRTALSRRAEGSSEPTRKDGCASKVQSGLRCSLTQAAETRSRR
jgi:glycosyltransferase involved in cell wall biosynthesis